MSPTPPGQAQLERGRRESWALRLLREGSTPRHIIETTGIPMARLRDLAASIPRVTTAAPCCEPLCGQPKPTSGQPRKGWIKVHTVGEPHLWLCSWACVARHAHTRRGGT